MPAISLKFAGTIPKPRDHNETAYRMMPRQDFFYLILELKNFYVSDSVKTVRTAEMSRVRAGIERDQNSRFEVAPCWCHWLSRIRSTRIQTEGCNLCGSSAAKPTATRSILPVIVFGTVPSIMKPPIITPSAVCVRARVERFTS